MYVILKIVRVIFFLLIKNNKLLNIKLGKLLLKSIIFYNL